MRPSSVTVDASGSTVKPTTPLKSFVPSYSETGIATRLVSAQ